MNRACNTLQSNLTGRVRGNSTSTFLHDVQSLNVPERIKMRSFFIGTFKCKLTKEHAAELATPDIISQLDAPPTR